MPDKSLYMATTPIFQSKLQKLQVIFLNSSSQVDWSLPGPLVAQYSTKIGGS
jgi:hypothetical protein